MEVILLENIKNLGQVGDIVKVKRGHGRNFLIKYGKALRASKENIEIVNKKKEELNQKNLSFKKEAKKIYEAINDKKKHKFCLKIRKRLSFCVDVHLCKNNFYTINEYSLTQKE